MRRPVPRTGCCKLPSYRRARSAKDKKIKETGMKKISTTRGKAIRKMHPEKLTIGLDLGDRSSWYSVLDEKGETNSRAEAQHNTEGEGRGVRRHAAESHRAGNGDAAKARARTIMFLPGRTEHRSR